jgi:hypothetical protein
VDEDFVTDLKVRDLELDEQWSFAGSKKAEFAASAERGEAWWHKAMARESRLLVEQFVSPRTTEATEMLINQSFDRLAAGCLPHISSDGYDAYTQPLSEQIRALTVYPLWWALCLFQQFKQLQTENSVISTKVAATLPATSHNYMKATPRSGLASSVKYQWRRNLRYLELQRAQ